MVAAHAAPTVCVLVAGVAFSKKLLRVLQPSRGLSQTLQRLNMVFHLFLKSIAKKEGGRLRKSALL